MEQKKSAGKALLAAATVLGLGYAPLASGTVGSLGGVALQFLMARLWWPYYILVWAALLVFAFWVSHRVMLATGQDDPSIVVIDEVVGYLAAVFLLPFTPGYVIAAFLLFRAFDVIKPFPASYFDQKVKNGIGIVMDDVVAGAYACIIIHLYRLVWG